MLNVTSTNFILYVTGVTVIDIPQQVAITCPTRPAGFPANRAALTVKRHGNNGLLSATLASQSSSRHVFSLGARSTEVRHKRDKSTQRRANFSGTHRPSLRYSSLATEKLLLRRVAGFDLKRTIMAPYRRQKLCR